MHELIRSTAFIRAARRFVKKNPQAADDVRIALGMLAADAFDSRLKTHTLKGDLAGTWACSAGRDLRILFEFVTRNGVEAIPLLSMGTHDDVY